MDHDVANVALAAALLGVAK